MDCRFYELENNLEYPGRWHLRYLMDAAENRFDAREFTYGNRVDRGPPLRCGLWNEEKVIDVTPPLTLYRSYEGTPLDFTFTDSCMPVATKRVADILGELGGQDIQRFPVRVDCIEEDFEIINVVACVDCLDTERSEISEWWEEGNDIRPDKAGMPHVIDRLVIDPERVGDHRIFRIKTWTVPVIVSEAVKQALEEARVSGVLFRPVS